MRLLTAAAIAGGGGPEPGPDIPNTLADTIESPTGINDRFGIGISILDSHISIGSKDYKVAADYRGRAYIYNMPPNTVSQTIDNPASGTHSLFGQSISNTDTYTIVGASNEDTDGTDGGIAYVYLNSNGSLTRTMTNPTSLDYSHFGFSISSIDSYLVVSAESDSTTSSNSGRVYIYNTSNGSALNTIENPGSSGARFGTSVSTTDTRVVVGAPQDNGSGSFSGRAYIFDVSTGNLIAELENPGIAGILFGNSVSTTDTYTATGSPLSSGNSGRAYIFDATTGSLLHTLNNPVPEADANFGNTVAIMDDYTIIGAPGYSSERGRAYAFSNITGELVWTYDNPSATTGRFGEGISITKTGSRLAISAPAHSSGVGIAYMYKI